MISAGGSERGRRSGANFAVLRIERDPPLAVVADGMGDSEGSAVAARTAVDVFVENLTGTDPTTLRHAVAEAQRRVRAAGARIAGLTGRTPTAVLPTGPGRALIAPGRRPPGDPGRPRAPRPLPADHTARGRRGRPGRA